MRWRPGFGRGASFSDMSEPRPQTARELAIAIHAAAVGGVDPRSATRRAVSARLTSASAPVWIIALGKASTAMAEAAVDVLRDHQMRTGGRRHRRARAAALPTPAPRERGR